MAIWQAFKVSRKTFFNPKAWLDYDALKTDNRILWDIIVNTFSVPRPLRKETFHQAMQRLNLSEEAVQRTSSYYHLFAYFFLMLGIATAVFGLYLLFSHASITGWVLAFSAAMLFLANAFRYHFWFFQIKHRTLGCTFKEWWQGKPNDQSKNP